jgi:outer membrane immunogenic protein
VISDSWRRAAGLRGVACVAVALLLSTVSAAAQGAGWTGFYAGVNLGAEFLTGGAGAFCAEPGRSSFGPSCLTPTDMRVNQAGIAGGAQLGYLRQIDRAVLGIEADFSLLSAQANATMLSPGQVFEPVDPRVPNVQAVMQKIDWLATVRGRAGYDFGRLLAFVTGGLALGQTRLDGRLDIVGFNQSWASGGSATMLGYAAGGGVEYALLDRWTVRAEALYFDLGSQSIWETGPGGYTMGFAARFDGVIARLAANYRF